MPPIIQTSVKFRHFAEPSLRAIYWKLAKIYDREIAKFYRRLYGGGQVCAPNHTNVCNISRLCGAVSSSVSNISPSNLANFLILWCSFHWCRWIFEKAGKKPWKGLLPGAGFKISEAVLRL